MKYRITISNFTLFIIVNLLLFVINILTVNNLKVFFLLSSWLVFLYAGVTAIFIPFPRIQKLVFTIFYSLSAILGFFKLKLGIVYSFEIAASTIQTINEPNIAFELMDFYFYLWLILIVILPIVLVCFFTKVKKAKLKEALKPSIITIALSMLLSGIIAFFIVGGFKVRSVDDHTLRKSLSYYSPFDIIHFTPRAIRSIKRQKDLFKSAGFTHLSKHYEYGFEAPEDLKIIFILGETVRGDKFSMKELTPNLSKLKGLYRFKEATSCHTDTLSSTRCMFSRMRYETYSPYITESAFTDVLTDVGFKSTIFTLQGMMDFYHYLGFDKLTSKYELLKDTNGLGMDGDLLEGFLEYEKNMPPGKEFVLLHTVGAHYSYFERYPKEFEIIKPSCNASKKGACTKEETINSYHNAILYSDKIISDIIDASNKYNSIVFFISDHGEQLGENGFFGHASPKGSVKEDHDIAFLIYLSPKLLSTAYGKSLQTALNANVLKTNISHDNVFHTVLGCAGIYNKNKQKPLIDETLNLCYQK